MNETFFFSQKPSNHEHDTNFCRSAKQSVIIQEKKEVSRIFLAPKSGFAYLTVEIAGEGVGRKKLY